MKRQTGNSKWSPTMLMSVLFNIVSLVVIVSFGLYYPTFCDYFRDSETNQALDSAVHQLRSTIQNLQPQPLNSQQILPSNDKNPSQLLSVSTLASTSSLHPDWSDKVLAASEKISFQKFQASDSRGRSTSFWYAVEEVLHSASYIETQEREVVKFWLNTIGSTQDAGKSCNVLDIGSNGGYFSLLSRSANCNVLAVDAQPWCLTRLSSSAAVNGFHDKLSTRWTAVSDSASLQITVGATKCSGLWAVKNSAWINEESSSTVTVSSSTVESIVSSWIPPSETIVLMKIDAEGSEISIIRSALPLLKEKRIKHIAAEFVPGRTKDITPYEVVCDTFDQLYSYGYSCVNDLEGLSDHTPKTVQEMKTMFDPTSTAKGRNNPQMWRCSASNS